MDRALLPKLSTKMGSRGPCPPPAQLSTIILTAPPAPPILGPDAQGSLTELLTTCPGSLPAPPAPDPLLTAPPTPDPLLTAPLGPPAGEERAWASSPRPPALGTGTSPKTSWVVAMSPNGQVGVLEVPRVGPHGQLRSWECVPLCLGGSPCCTCVGGAVRCARLQRQHGGEGGRKGRRRGQVSARLRWVEGVDKGTWHMTR